MAEGFYSTDRIFNIVFDPDTGTLQVQVASGSEIKATIEPGDIQIGAVELKDANTEARAVIDALGRLAVLADNLPSLGGEPSRKTVTDTPTLLLAENQNRKKYFIQNLDEDIDIYLGGSAVAITTGILAPAFGGFGDDMPYCGIEAIYAIASSGNSVEVVIKEWE